jgi:aminopeptidase
MSDLRRSKLADILVNYSVKVQPGEWVLIQGDLSTEPLVRDVVEKVLQAGGHPDVFLNSEDIAETRLRVSNEEQLKWVSPIMFKAIKEADVFISFWGGRNTRYQSGIDPARLQTRLRGQTEFREIYLNRIMSGDLRWVGTQYPCNAYAQEADMSLREYEDFVYSATFADQDDPVAHWQKIHDDQEKYITWLKGKKQVVVRSPYADLSLSIEGRDFINSAGKQNMPSGEIYTSPVEDSANGWIEFTYPAINDGREVEGIRLEFQDGKVVNASARKNEAYLLTMLDTDEGSRYLGEFAVGTNYGIQRFTKNILFDEKIGGSIHLAIGRGFPQIGSKNVSNVHWDMICDMRQDSQILVDGELFYKDGQFQI